MRFDVLRMEALVAKAKDCSCECCAKTEDVKQHLLGLVRDGSINAITLDGGIVFVKYVPAKGRKATK